MVFSSIFATRDNYQKINRSYNYIVKQSLVIMIYFITNMGIESRNYLCKCAKKIIFRIFKALYG